MEGYARTHEAADEWLLAPEVEAEFRIPVATLYGWRHRGIGPKSVRLGRRVMYRRSDVEEWIEQRFAAEAEHTDGAT
jgi:predicted DNA-binding transcriptional regulator AlpA